MVHLTTKDRTVLIIFIVTSIFVVGGLIAILVVETKIHTPLGTLNGYVPLAPRPTGPATNFPPPG